MTLLSCLIQFASRVKWRIHGGRCHLEKINKLPYLGKGLTVTNRDEIWHSDAN